MERLRLTLSCNEYDRTRFLVDGTAQAEGIDLTVVSLPSEERHRRFSRETQRTLLTSWTYLDQRPQRLKFHLDNNVPSLRLCGDVNAEPGRKCFPIHFVGGHLHDNCFLLIH